MTATRVQLWHGPDVVEAAAAYARAKAANFSELRARIFGSIASWKDCWTLQATLARFHDCSVRTVQRAAHDAKEQGFMGSAFAKPGEKPPGAKEPVPFKWCHRWIIGRGKAGAALQEAVNKARAAWVITNAGLRRTFNAPQPKPKKNARMTAEQIDEALDQEQAKHEPELLQPSPAAKRRMTADEIDAELAALERARGPDR